MLFSLIWSRNIILKRHLILCLCYNLNIKLLIVTRNNMICVQCSESAKYKCPICRKPYCSVACCKVHRTAPCSPPTPPLEQVQASETNENYEYPTEDTVPVEKFKLLEHSNELRKCLDNPHVRDILRLLDKSPNPDMMIKEYMQEPIFTEFVDACLNVVQEKQND